MNPKRWIAAIAALVLAGAASLLVASPASSHGDECHEEDPADCPPPEEEPPAEEPPAEEPGDGHEDDGHGHEDDGHGHDDGGDDMGGDKAPEPAPEVPGEPGFTG